jgi:hypothetical protein
VEQGGGQQVGVVVPRRQQPCGHVQAVASIGDRHGVEQGCGPTPKEPMRQRHLIGFDACPHVGDELVDPMHR